MKRYIVRILLFFFIVIVADQLCGLAMEYVNSHAKGGATKDNYDVFNNVTADVVILGSSRAYHHYNPKIIEDSLGLSCHNCGYDAAGILNMYGRIVEICKRKAPQIVLYDLMSSGDIYGSDNIKEISGLKPYCNRDSIASIIKSVSPIESIKTLSCSYRYNSDVFQFLRDIIKLNGISEKGFVPMHNVMNYDTEPFAPKFNGEDPDELKMLYLKKLIVLSRKEGFQLFFCISPWYNADTDTEFQPVFDLCKRNNIAVFNHFCDSINRNKSLFADQLHLNTNGADSYTQRIVSQLNIALSNDKQ